ncbi:UDP-2,3-diacylglucosamine diphosphatase [Robertkochia sediminum]|uniref:UDP-2,3-diacylglucosamine diphosphatase n=1 Tax=Robertkochia sediminum TaxID=2785326 RepID=UPI001932403E|nr:UDP-2,3-diacylglucosamine diphosphatase [Robertkochia sediminum]MBL7473502.1 UDP-2,3-diacylglucosamine diphosphatase [Robertkochia sediminum]
MKKRRTELVVLSDIHLGTYGCHAGELLSYLNSVQPEILVLNGDIIDVWQFRKRYFPKEHLQVIKKILDMAAKGTKVYYITGNHDEMFRKFTDLHIGNIHVVNKLVLDLDGKKAWIFHGDVFDASIQHAKWIAKLGGWGYELLIRVNTLLNAALLFMGKERYSLSKKIKNSVKKAVKYIDDFEQVAADLAIDNGYKYVVCGHIHQPQMIRKVNDKGTCLYLNSGDWIENLTALEYSRKQWELYRFKNDKLSPFFADQNLKEMDYKDLLAAITITPRL